MTMTISISPELVANVQAEAARRGQSPDALVETALSLLLSETARPGRSWSEIEGAADYPLMGEDAQFWVTRTRRKGNGRFGLNFEGNAP